MRKSFVCLSIGFLVAVTHLAAQEPTTEIVAGFVPSGAELVLLRPYDEEKQQLGPSKVAVLRGSVVSPKSEDIIFAYTTPSSGAMDKTLFVAMLHKTPSGYIKVFEKSFYGKVLLSGDALQLVRLSDRGPNAVAVFAGTGASLGGRLFLYRWNAVTVTVNGMENIMPPEAGGHRVWFDQRKSGLRVILSNEKYLGQKDALPPVSFRWNGKEFVKAN